MTSVRKRKVEITLASLRQAAINALEDKLWDQMPPVGREFGSPHFERLMAEDHRDSVGVFDPALKGLFASEIDIPEEMKPQRRRPL